MVADQAGDMKNARQALWIGLTYTVPLSVWTLFQLSTTGGHTAASHVLYSSSSLAAVIQATVLSLHIPRAFDETPAGSDLYTLLILISIPWPLFTLAWLAGAITFGMLCLSQAGVILFALLLRTATHCLLRLTDRGENRNLLLTGLQLLAITLVVIFPLDWVVR